MCFLGKETEAKGGQRETNNKSHQKFHNHYDSHHSFLGFQILTPRQNEKGKRGSHSAWLWLSVDHSKLA